MYYTFWQLKTQWTAFKRLSGCGGTNLRSQHSGGLCSKNLKLRSVSATEWNQARLSYQVKVGCRVTQALGAPSTLAEIWGSVPSTKILVVGNSSSRGSDALLWHPWALYMHTLIYPTNCCPDHSNEQAYKVGLQYRIQTSERCKHRFCHIPLLVYLLPIPLINTHISTNLFTLIIHSNLFSWDRKSVV